MSDDPNRPNRPDPDQELEVDISAFLPEGSRFATDDEPGDDTPAATTDAAATVEAAPGGGASDSNAPNHADGWETGAPAPEIPAWARDDLPPPPSVTDDAAPAAGADGEVGDEGDAHAAAVEPETAPVADAGPAVPAAPEVDTTVLTRIEGELADVDAAITAIDAGDLTRSPLLTELLAASQTDSASRPPSAADQTASPGRADQTAGGEPDL